MDADFSVELGADDDALEFPWASPDGELRYYDLKHQPELLLYIREASDYPELGRYLATVNSERSVILTAKCDVWREDELSEVEAIYEAKIKLGCYVDHLFVAEDVRFDFERHERVAERMISCWEECRRSAPPSRSSSGAVITIWTTNRCGLAFT